MNQESITKNQLFKRFKEEWKEERKQKLWSIAVKKIHDYKEEEVRNEEGYLLAVGYRVDEDLSIYVDKRAENITFFKEGKEILNITKDSDLFLLMENLL